MPGGSQLLVFGVTPPLAEAAQGRDRRDDPNHKLWPTMDYNIWGFKGGFHRLPIVKWDINGFFDGILTDVMDGCGGFHNGGSPIAGWFISWKIPSRNG